MNAQRFGDELEGGPGALPRTDPASFRATLRAVLAPGSGAVLPDDVLHARARDPGTKLELVALSLRQQDGADLTAAERALLGTWRARLDLLAAVQDGIERAVPGTACVKGSQLAALYPAGVVRTQNDVDLVVGDVDGVWDAVEVARGHGFALVTLAVFVLAGEVHLVVGLERVDETPVPMPSAGVELATLDFAGKGLALPPRPRVPGTGRHWVRQGLALLEERLQRPFRLRDDLDFALLAAATAPGDAVALGRAAAFCGLTRALREMAGRLAAAGLDLPAVAAAVAASGSPARERARMVAAAARHLPRPQVLLTSCARRLATRDRELPLPPAVADRLLGATDKPALLRAGLCLYGLQVDDDERDFALSRRGRQAVATTPAGTFLLVPAGTVAPAWIEEAGFDVPP